jgi:esterase/lipase
MSSQRSDYDLAKNNIIEQTKLHENNLPLKNLACGSQFFLHSQPTTKVCLFFHGFTAAPYQFKALAEVLFNSGYNVLIPLLPGHGIAGNWNSRNPPPLPTKAKPYQDFAHQWLQVAHNFGDQVIIGGLSGGATLAAWLALEYAQEIYKVLLFAPYLSSSNNILDILVQALPIYIDWGKKDNSSNLGYQGFKMPGLEVFADLGQYILKQAPNRKLPSIFILSSESDQAIDHQELLSLFESSLMYQPKSWFYCFDKFFKVPHAMMTKAEGNQYQDLLITITKAYIESDISWRDLLKIGDGILQGKRFEVAVKELKLLNRVSPDLEVLLAVLNKKVLV